MSINYFSRLPTLADRENLHCVEATILEIFRFSSAAPTAIPHMSITNSTLGEYFIPRGTQVTFKLY